MTSLKEISEELKKINSAIIFAHNRPDGDTIGSTLALRKVLIDMGVDVDVCCSQVIPDKFYFLNGVNSFILPENISKKYDLAIACDCSTEPMFAESYIPYMSYKKRINIDHHISNSRHGTLNYVEDTSANCENMYKLFVEMGVTIDKDIAICLMTGIMTDSGSFEHSNTTKQTFEIAASLYDLGGDTSYIATEMFKNQSKERALLYARVISNIRFAENGQIAYIVTNLKDLEETGALQSDTEGFIDFPLSIKGVEVALAFLQVPNNKYKISFRSKKYVDVNEIAGLYGGGGHKQASGAQMYGCIEELLDRILFDIKQRL